MTGSDYSYYLQTDHWSDTREKRIQKDGGRCYFCGASENLNVHHRSYENLFDEKEDDIITLCRDCHRKLHTALDLTRDGFYRMKQEYTVKVNDEIKDQKVMLFESASTLLANMVYMIAGQNAQEGQRVAAMLNTDLQRKSPWYQCRISSGGVIYSRSLQKFKDLRKRGPLYDSK